MSQREDIEKAITLLRANKEVFETAHGELAVIYKMAFDNFVRSGFTEVQALDLLKARGLS